MKILDLNVLVYTTDAESAHHASAKPWLDGLLATTETVGIPTAVAVGYVRLTTSPRVMVEPLDAAAAISIVTGWLRRPTVTTPAPTRRHFEILGELLAPVGTAGNLVSDAHLGALAIEHGAELCSYDHDVGRFGGVVWVNPADASGA